MVETIDETSRFPHPEVLTETLEALLEERGLEDRSLTVVLLDDDAMRRFNREHRGVDEPTDVLSYPTGEPDDVGVPAVDHLGDVLIGLDTAGRQARESGRELLDEVLELAAHGFTHLLGYDHTTEEEWQTFREAQRRILELRSAG